MAEPPVISDTSPLINLAGSDTLICYRASMARFLYHFTTLLQGLGQDPGRPLAGLPAVVDQARQFPRMPAIGRA